MALTMLENLQTIVQNTLTDSIKMIDIDELHDAADNFFVIDRIEEFADTILGQGGVKDNLIVRPLETGGYEIISGHRRRAAVQLLLDRGENISRLLPCLVQNYTDEDARLLDLVLMNVSARQLTDAELWRSYELLDRILKDKKGSGERFGRVREKLSELLGVSPAQIGKMQNVTNHAIPDVVEAVQNGDLSISTANEIAKMDKAEQEQLVQHGVLSEVRHKEVRAQNQKPKPVPKVDTCSTFREDTPEPEEDDSEDDAAEVDTYSTFPEDTPEPEGGETAKVDTCSTKTADPLTGFIYDHYYDLEEIFTSYTSMTDSEEEVRLLETLREFLRCIRESERQRRRLLGAM